MKTQNIKSILLSATMLLVGSGVALADKPCRTSTLDGVYAFQASGFNIVGGIAQPKTILEMIVFNGDGTLTTPKATLSLNGNIIRSAPGDSGTYVVNSDCTGNLTFGTTGPKFDMVIGPKASQLYMIQTSPGAPVFSGTANQVSD